MDNVGQQLKTLRQRRGLSQRKLAQLAGVSNATVSLIEHGKTDPSMGPVKKDPGFTRGFICRVLRCRDAIRRKVFLRAR